MYWATLAPTGEEPEPPMPNSCAHHLLMVGPAKAAFALVRWCFLVLACSGLPYDDPRLLKIVCRVAERWRERVLESAADREGDGAEHARAVRQSVPPQSDHSGCSVGYAVVASYGGQHELFHGSKLPRLVVRVCVCGWGGAARRGLWLGPM